MEKIGIFYGSTTGQTESLAHMIAERLGVAAPDVRDVASSSPSDVEGYDVLLFGTSTWGSGDMQDDMHDFLDGVSAMTLKGKKVGLFGCGDDTMRDTFCNAIGEMYEMLKPTGAEMIGSFNGMGFEYEHSKAEVDGRIVGLMIDNVNHQSMTAGRVAEWTDEIRRSI